MSPLGLLLLLWAFSRRNSPNVDPWQAPAPKPKPPEPWNTPASGWLQPASYGGGAPPQSKWKPYKPLTSAIIERAQKILNDPTAHEVIEPDPNDKTQVVRYLRTTDSPPGHVNVTAWRARERSATPSRVRM